MKGLAIVCGKGGKLVAGSIGVPERRALGKRGGIAAGTFASSRIAIGRAANRTLARSLLSPVTPAPGGPPAAGPYGLKSGTFAIITDLLFSVTMPEYCQYLISFSDFVRQEEHILGDLTTE
jgi:hypothetical protein